MAEKSLQKTGLAVGATSWGVAVGASGHIPSSTRGALEALMAEPKTEPKRTLMGLEDDHGDAAATLAAGHSPSLQVLLEKARAVCGCGGSFRSGFGCCLSPASYMGRLSASR